MQIKNGIVNGVLKVVGKLKATSIEVSNANKQGVTVRNISVVNNANTAQQNTGYILMLRK